MVARPGGCVTWKYASTSLQSGGIALNIQIDGASRIANRTAGATNPTRRGLEALQFLKRTNT